MSKTTRFYTTINEAKQLMKLSIYNKWIKDKADMFYYTETVEFGLAGDYDETRISVGVPLSRYDTPSWSTDALIKVCNDLGLMVIIYDTGILVERDPDSVNKDNQFDSIIDGTCLPWMLVKVLKEYDNKYGTN